MRRPTPTKPDPFFTQRLTVRGPDTGRQLTNAASTDTSYGVSRRIVSRMAIQRKSTKPVGITNESGQPEIVLEIDGLTLSMTPPAQAAPADPKDDDKG